MEEKIVFPYEHIKKNANVVIYGLGKYGKNYIEQIERTQYCNVFGVCDKSEDAFIEGYPKIEKENLNKGGFDNVIIALSDPKISSDVYWDLIRLGIEKEKIVSPFDGASVFFPVYCPEQYSTAGLQINISITMDGGIGDYVVYIPFLRRIVEVVPNAIIDIYGKKNIADAVFSREKNINEILDADTGRENPIKFVRKYILALRLMFFPQVEYVDYSMKKIAPVLYNKINEMLSDNRIRDLQYIDGRFLSIYHRAKLFGLDRYAFLGQGNIWKINSEDGRIYPRELFKKEFLRLGLTRYITVNYGASEVRGAAGKKQTKVWDIKHYEELLCAIKKHYPDITIVQLGDARAPELVNTDLAVLGEQLGLVEYILSNSLIHIDCEGGLVHIATQLGTKCVVLFGPTPVWFYGYNKNVNITSKKCNDCCHVRGEWYTECILGDAVPRCMEDIKVETVFGAVSRELDSKRARREENI